VRLTPVARLVLLTHHWIYFTILLSWMTHIWWFGAAWLEMFFYPFFSFSFFLDLRASHAKNQINPLIDFFFQFNPSSFICNFFYLYWLLLIGFYFFISPLVI
jgi:hypothetical protein